MTDREWREVCARLSTVVGDAHMASLPFGCDSRVLFFLREALAIESKSGTAAQCGAEAPSGHICNRAAGHSGDHEASQVSSRSVRWVGSLLPTGSKESDRG